MTNQPNPAPLTPPAEAAPGRLTQPRPAQTPSGQPPATQPLLPARSPAAGNPQWSWQFWVTVGLLLAFVILGIVMLAVADSNADVWRNRFAVFSAFNAIVSVAVGWLFGREVHRGEANTAKADAAGAKQDAAEAKAKERAAGAAAAEATRQAAVEVQKGEAVLAYVEDGLPEAPRQRSAGQSRDTAAGASVDDRLDALRAFARRIYS